MRSVGCAYFIVLAFAAVFGQATPTTPSGPRTRSLFARDGTTASDALDVPIGTADSLEVRDDYASTNHTRLDETLLGRDVYSPRITNPRTSTTWLTGQYVLVEWDTSDPPKSITNRNGKLVLGYMKDDSTSEHMFLDEPLAANFDIMKGYVKVKVPQVPPGSNYIVVLFGDSGNRSPEFTIN